MSLFERFQNEEQFREAFIKPLLNRLGFLRVAHYHGDHEQGKNFVFSEIDRFQAIRYHCAQVKHEATIRPGTTLDNLITQIKLAFAVPFTLADSPRDCFVSSVCIFNSGEITATAKEHFLRSFQKTDYGVNVMFLDGDRLDNLNRWGFQRANEDLHARSVGLRRQLTMNIWLWNLSLQGIKNNSEINLRGSMTHGIEAFATHPVLLDRIPLDDVVALWEDARFIDRFTENLMTPITVEPLQTASRAGIVTIAERAIPRAQGIIQKIDAALDAIQPL